MGANAVSDNVEKMFSDAQEQVLLGYDEVISRWPNRLAGNARISNLPEFEVGVKYLLARLFHHFGMYNIKTHTDIQFISTIAATPLPTFQRGGEKHSGIPGEMEEESHVGILNFHTGWFEYGESKIKGERLKDLMTAQGFKFNVITPDIFNTYINMLWLLFMRSVAGETLPPASSINADPLDGNFYYPLTPSSLHDTYVLGMNGGNTQHGAFVGGATYGALQYLGIYMKDKALQPMQRRTVFLDNPDVHSLPMLGNMPFGPRLPDMASSMLCYDVADPEQSIGYISHWKTWNAATQLADFWSVPSLAYLKPQNSTDA
jgi:hypothetical protein